MLQYIFADADWVTCFPRMYRPPTLFVYAWGHEQGGAGGEERRYLQQAMAVEVLTNHPYGNKFFFCTSKGARCPPPRHVAAGTMPSAIICLSVVLFVGKIASTSRPEWIDTNQNRHTLTAERNTPSAPTGSSRFRRSAVHFSDQNRSGVRNRAGHVLLRKRKKQNSGL